MQRLSIIVPCYNEEESISVFYEEIAKVRETLDASVELIFVDDGSRDGTLQIMRRYANEDASVRYISFSRNFGKEAAILAGLRRATGAYVAIMDVDLQDPPTLLPEMLTTVKNGAYDSVATRRVSRTGEPVIRSFFARMFYRLMNRISSTDMVDGARDYRLMNRKFVDALLALGEYNRFSKGLFGWVGFRTKWLAYENVQRARGETKWSFWKLFAYSLEGIIAFSTMPLVLASLAGIVLFVLAFASMAFIVGRKFLYGGSVEGWASMITVMLFLGGIQLLCVGILGQYMAKMYLETKQRPIYIVAESNLGDGECVC